MENPKILIVYATVHGHTRRVAERMARTLTAAGVDAEAADLERTSDPLASEGLRGVILAGPVRFGRHPRSLLRFAKRNRAALNRLPSAFVSVSGAASADEPAAREECRAYAEGFTNGTGWIPDRTLCAGGAFAFTRYNPLVRIVMRSISKKKGLSADTRRDRVYTDWDAVDRFAAALGRLVSEKERAGPPESSHRESPGATRDADARSTA